MSPELANMITNLATSIVAISTCIGSVVTAIKVVKNLITGNKNDMAQLQQNINAVMIENKELKKELKTLVNRERCIEVVEDESGE